MRVNRKVVEYVLRRGEPLHTAVERCVGKTTQAILYAIAESYSNFGTPVPVNDPDVYKITDKRWLARTVYDFIKHNNLTNIEVVCKYNGQVDIINTFAECLIQPPQFSRESTKQ